jgi:hypothetical protein
MKKFVTASILAAALFAAGSAVAMPLAPISPAPADVIEVAGGCGQGWHRGPNGGCRRNYAQPWLHPCPRGWYLGPYGRCRANGT